MSDSIANAATYFLEPWKEKKKEEEEEEEKVEEEEEEDLGPVVPVPHGEEGMEGGEGLEGCGLLVRHGPPLAHQGTCTLCRRKTFVQKSILNNLTCRFVEFVCVGQEGTFAGLGEVVVVGRLPPH